MSGYPKGQASVKGFIVTFSEVIIAERVIMFTIVILTLIMCFAMFSERLVKLMDYSEGSFQDFLGHCDAVNNVKFAPSGELLCSTSHAEILMWDVKA